MGEESQAHRDSHVQVRLGVPGVMGDVEMRGGGVLAAIRELNAEVVTLEAEMPKFSSNCRQIEKYQEDCLQVCEVWMQWMTQLPKEQNGAQKRHSLGIDHGSPLIRWIVLLQHTNWVVGLP